MALTDHVEFLTNKVGVRPPASQAERNASVYIENQFKEHGLETGTLVYPALRNYSWYYALAYLIYPLAVMIYPSRPWLAVALTFLAALLWRLDLYLWPGIVRIFAGSKKSQAVLGRKPAYEESRQIIFITAGYDSRKSYALGPRINRYYYRLILMGDILRSVQLLALTGGAVFTIFAMTRWSRILWRITWPGSLFLTLMMALELHRWLSGLWLSAVNDNDSSIAVLIGLAEELQRQPCQHCDVILAALGSDRDANLGMHKLLTLVEKELRSTTDVINLEAVGGGKLRILGREGISRPIPATDDLIDLGYMIAKGLNMEFQETEQSVLRTSGAIARSRGFRSVSLMGIDSDGLPCNFRETTKRSEKLAAVKEEKLSGVVDVIAQMIHLLDQQV
ncbi:MAG: hypothetical protein LLG09_06070 [Negativicutes bacterium]|nr:hypothetical protein [Negativicutes bacterium]